MQANFVVGVGLDERRVRPRDGVDLVRIRNVLAVLVGNTLREWNAGLRSFDILVLVERQEELDVFAVSSQFWSSPTVVASLVYDVATRSSSVSAPPPLAAVPAAVAFWLARHRRRRCRVARRRSRSRRHRRRRPPPPPPPAATAAARRPPPPPPPSSSAVVVVGRRAPACAAPHPRCRHCRRYWQALVLRLVAGVRRRRCRHPHAGGRAAFPLSTARRFAPATVRCMVTRGNVPCDTW
jgi:hypothetical protein